ncbi:MULTISPECIES: class I SAM-dependent methyltransferase [unclassified Roseateles]|uniref:class I SAM-dependent methyltransferase n=1 Tax=unclassified Roseateles TaxID=2626991 RepID=UPI0006FEB3CF|nr:MULTISPECIES: class I SAM-dependent methyltransferase [unclassified Roseateles]KQW42105.1 methyltransferase type 11 [Pelomonas sp. Root405]KRA67708.1 methyltransferase type 11 [Pelomonas sp. Root662]
MSELDEIAQRYARRADRGKADRYSLLRPEVWQMWQERQRELLKLLARRPGHPSEWRATEVGCGAGGNLLDLLRLGLLPSHLSGIELLPERLTAARASLPEGVRLIAGDASEADIAPASQDMVLQSTVFSSILDDALQRRVADAMWRWLKPGGAIVWYDFTINNPRNPDVRGVPLNRVRELFPQGRLTVRRVTLAPPLARALPSAYRVLNLFPFLRTHRLIWIQR